MLTRTHLRLALLGAAFLAPIMAVLAWNKDVILDDLTPRPENGYLVYVTMDLTGRAENADCHRRRNEDPQHRASCRDGKHVVRLPDL